MLSKLQLFLLLLPGRLPLTLVALRSIVERLREFTVHPPPSTTPSNNNNELLLMLKEDGSFQQYNNKENDIDRSWKSLQQSRRPETEALDQLHYQFLHGTWDFRDGKLLLAADRPKPCKSDDLRRLNQEKRETTVEENEKKKKASDTLLTGRVVAKYQSKLRDTQHSINEESKESNVKASASSSSSNNNNVSVDTYLSVPKGSVKVGRFFYPRNHPSFFDQPMYEPKKRGTVSLRQVLGALNTADNDEEELVEKFRTTNFYNKTFLLTSHPIGFRAPKDKRKKSDETELRPESVRVMQMRFHANNTFSTVAGLGENILRGKFSIMGNVRDQLWMQISRFGFGRSVSGSVYSEGNGISHEDAKSYWGTIGFQEERTNATASNQTDSEATQLIEVKGSVLFGWGIEPIPEARFIMREVASDESTEEDDEDDDEDRLRLQLESKTDLPALGEEDGIDLSDSGSFQ